MGRMIHWKDLNASSPTYEYKGRAGSWAQPKRFPRHSEVRAADPAETDLEVTGPEAAADLAAGPAGVAPAEAGPVQAAAGPAVAEHPAAAREMESAVRPRASDLDSPPRSG